MTRLATQVYAIADSHLLQLSLAAVLVAFFRQRYSETNPPNSVAT